VASHGRFEASAEAGTHDGGDDRLVRLLDLEEKVLAAFGQGRGLLCVLASEKKKKVVLGKSNF
jgi:hypothetical protein